ncbi:MAG: hypothetical protein U0324_03185 [Polyangiales bacterium]
MFAVRFLSLGCLCGCASVVTPDHVAADASPPPADAVADAPSVPRDDLDSFAAVGAAAVCEGLFRCCDAGSRAAFRAGYRFDPRTQALEAEPPFSDEAGCRRYFATKLGGGPFADWIDAARRGLVRYDPDASVACRRAIATAACGEPMRNALANGACYGAFASPIDGRRMFARSAGAGDPCRAVRDESVIGMFHGSCAPSSYCCVPAPDGSGRCLSPWESVRTGVVEGRCRAASRAGAPCTGPVGLNEDYRACADTLVCARDASGCQPAEPDVDLPLGARCFDTTRGLWVGRCPAGSRCDTSDTTASYTCVRTLANGEPCERDSLCETYVCREGRCAQSDFVCGG